jgi:hypothetical protein
MSNMLTSIVSAALEQSSALSSPGRAGERDDLAVQIRLMQADAVLIRATRAERLLALSSSAARLFEKIVAITSDGNHGFLHELRPRSSRIMELSAAMRAALRSGPSQQTL